MAIQSSNSTNPNGEAIRLNLKMPTAVLAVACCCFLSGCASFSDAPIRHHKVKLTESNLSELSGAYELYPDSNLGGKAGLQAYLSKDDRFHQYIGKSKIGFDTLANCSVVVQVSRDHVNFLFKEDGLTKDSVRLTFRLQSRGMLLLGNKYVTLEGIPYILGGSRSEKTRIGLAKDGGLILNHAYDDSGALLLFIGLGLSYDVAYHFKRIKL
jgi:hypothetical protein